jgi:hypothetical protein
MRCSQSLLDGLNLVAQFGLLQNSEPPTSLHSLLQLGNQLMLPPSDEQHRLAHLFA